MSNTSVTIAAASAATGAMAGSQHEPFRPVETMLPREVAARLGVTEGCLAKWRMLGTGPAFVRVSHRRVVYPVAAFNAFMAARQRASTMSGAGPVDAAA